MVLAYIYIFVVYISNYNHLIHCVWVCLFFCDLSIFFSLSLQHKASQSVQHVHQYTSTLYKYRVMLKDQHKILFNDQILWAKRWSVVRYFFLFLLNACCYYYVLQYGAHHAYTCVCVCWLHQASKACSSWTFIR